MFHFDEGPRSSADFNGRLFIPGVVVFMGKKLAPTHVAVVVENRRYRVKCSSVVFFSLILNWTRKYNQLKFTLKYNLRGESRHMVFEPTEFIVQIGDICILLFEESIYEDKLDLGFSLLSKFNAITDTALLQNTVTRRELIPF
uniref:AlNc14C929G12642 protein n=1 Tax=Albugo laibachii Nc14 TaxID=890382 RepID=F0X2A6_9STRA|nr:AlNc14C929G12642 [Albugo laibachii Nc14]|eukprot:CCA27986.1 AlNc14C929G12642 [Albugo laibachii Nc14]